MCARVRDAEADRDDVQKARCLGRGGGRVQIGARVKLQLIGAGGELPLRQDRGIGAPVIIRDLARQMDTALPVEPVEVDGQTCRRAASRGIQNMSGQVALGHETLLRCGFDGQSSPSHSAGQGEIPRADCQISLYRIS